MTNINGPRFSRPSAFPTPATGSTPATGATPATPASTTTEPAASFDATGGTASAPAAGLPRGGWADSTSLRASANRARNRLNEETAPEGTNFRGGSSGSDIDDLIGRPVVRPMYGVIMPTPPNEGEILSELKDKGLKRAFTGMLADGLLDKGEAETLIKAAMDGGRMTKTEKKDLGTILSRLRYSIGWNARGVIEGAIAGGNLKDRGLREAFKGALDDMRVDGPEVRRLINAALDGPGLSKTERKDLEYLLQSFAFTDVAEVQLASFLADPNGPVIGLPIPPPRAMYGVAMPAAPRIKDKGLRLALDKAFEDFYVSSSDADALIAAAKDGPGLSKTEKKDIENLLSEIGNMFMAPEARTKLARLIGQPVDVLPDPDPVVRPMYGVIMPDPDPDPFPDPVVRPMYGVIMPDPIDPGPVVRPLYGVFEPVDPPIVAEYGVAMPLDPSDG